MIVNQTWLNPNDINQERGWVLLSLCLGCFAPSAKLYPYLLCHVTAHAYEQYKGYCQSKLLMSYGRQARQFPPSMVEWEATASCSPMAISVHLADGVTKVLPVTSALTAQELGSMAVTARGVPSGAGWTVSVINNNGDVHEFESDAPVMDYFSKSETNPLFVSTMRAHDTGMNAPGVSTKGGDLLPMLSPQPGQKRPSRTQTMTMRFREYDSMPPSATLSTD